MENLEKYASIIAFAGGFVGMVEQAILHAFGVEPSLYLISGFLTMMFGGGIIAIGSKTKQNPNDS